MKIDDLKNAHKYSSYHKEQLSNAKHCGCFYCTRIFDPKEIVDWCDNGQTAVCPYCGIDSILPENDAFPISKEFLMQMRKHWFY